jgi:hypothetical protein
MSSDSTAHDAQTPDALPPCETCTNPTKICLYHNPLLNTSGDVPAVLRSHFSPDGEATDDESSSLLTGTNVFLGEHRASVLRNLCDDLKALDAESLYTNSAAISVIDGILHEYTTRTSCTEEKPHE